MEIYNQFEIPFQDFCNQVAVIFRKQDYLNSRIPYPYCKESQLLSLKQDVEEMLFHDRHIILSKESLEEIISILKTTYDYPSEFEISNIKLLIEGINSEKESRQSYLTKISKIKCDLQRASDTVGNCYRMFITKEQWQQLTELYHDVCFVVEELKDHMMDASIQNILLGIEDMILLPVPSNKKELYRFYQQDFSRFEELFSSVVSYHSRLYMEDFSWLIDRIQRLMSSGLVTREQTKSRMISMDETMVSELVSLNEKRLRLYHIISMFDPNFGELTTKLQSGEYDDLYDRVLQRIEKEDYVSMLSSVSTTQLDSYFKICTMLRNSEPIREEECMKVVADCAKQMIKNGKC